METGVEEGDANLYGQHDGQRSNNRGEAGKQPRQPLEQSVGYLVHVVNQGVGDVPVRGLVDEPKGYARQSLEGEQAHIPYRIIGDLVGAMGHPPLEEGA